MSVTGIIALTVVTLAWLADAALKAMVGTGQNSHHWQETTPVVKWPLEVAVPLAKGQGTSLLMKPVFAAHDRVRNYKGNS